MATIHETQQMLGFSEEDKAALIAQRRAELDRIYEDELRRQLAGQWLWNSFAPRWQTSTVPMLQATFNRISALIERTAKTAARK